jgi:hypothetical protein
MKLISISHDTGFPPGVVYEASHELGSSHLVANLAQKVVSVEGESVKSISATDLRRKVEGPNLPPWDRRLTPEQYLRRYPNSPISEVARLYVEAGLGQVRTE